MTASCHTTLEMGVSDHQRHVLDRCGTPFKWFFEMSIHARAQFFSAVQLNVLHKIP